MINLQSDYDREHDLLVFKLGGVCSIVVPFEFVKQSYYEAKKIRDKVKGGIILPDAVEEKIETNKKEN